MKLFVALVLTASAVCAAPNLLPPSQPGYNYPAPQGPGLHEGGSAAGAAASHGSAASSSHSSASSSSSHSSSSTSSASAHGSVTRASAPALVIAILRDNRVQPDETGAYAFDFESEDGQTREEAGQAGATGAVVQTGSYSYTSPDGTPFQLSYIADENGFQPQSDSLPALPQFVIDQIEFAKTEGAAAASAGAAVVRDSAAAEGSHSSSASATAEGSHSSSAPAQSYLTPQ